MYTYTIYIYIYIHIYPHPRLQGLPRWKQTQKNAGKAKAWRQESRAGDNLMTFNV